VIYIILIFKCSINGVR